MPSESNRMPQSRIFLEFSWDSINSTSKHYIAGRAPPLSVLIGFQKFDIANLIPKIKYIRDSWNSFPMFLS